MAPQVSIPSSKINLLLLEQLATKSQSLSGERNRSNAQLINFLQQELSISTASIAMALRHSEQDPGPLHMILWQYGLVSLEELEQIFDWLEH